MEQEKLKDLIFFWSNQLEERLKELPSMVDSKILKEIINVHYRGIIKAYIEEALPELEKKLAELKTEYLAKQGKSSGFYLAKVQSEIITTKAMLKAYYQSHHGVSEDMRNKFVFKFLAEKYPAVLEDYRLAVDKIYPPSNTLK